MVAIKLQAFGGMIPAQDDRLLPENNAALSQNTWLYDGKITGIRVPKLLHTLVNASYLSVYRIPKTGTGVNYLADAYWLEFPLVNTSVVKGSINNSGDPPYYYCDGVNPPRYTTLSRIVAASGDLLLGIPAPAAPPTVTHTGGSSSTTETRAYVFTHVSAYGEEGPPSPPSVVATGKIDDTWGLTIPAVGGDATDRDITHTNIYRTVTSDQGVATFFFVAQIAVATTTYNDTANSAVIVLNEEMTSLTYSPPPTLQGMVAMPNGMIIGWMDNELWFCEPYHPHAWPAAYQLSTEFKVVGIGVYGQTAVVCTQGTPYQCSGVQPASMALAKITGLPESCISQGSVVTAPEGVYYSSPAGLVLVGPGKQGVATRQLIPKDTWQELLNVNNLNAAMLAQAYYTFSGIAQGCFEPTAFEETAFEFVDFTGTRNGALIELSDSRVAFTELTVDDPVYNVLKDPWTNEILIITKGGVYQVDITTSSMQGSYLWRSKIFQMPKLTNLKVCQIFWGAPANVVSPSSNVRVYGDGALLIDRAIPASGSFFNLPAGKRYNNYQFEIEGNLLIENFNVATSAKELKVV